ncbi:MAG: hypothetical protein IE932_10915 [Sphingopyxis terrae]|nr:hypothetical protein [Sphingopyxis terrae]
MTSNGKPWWQSKTIWAALVVFLVTIAPELGVGITDQDAADGGGALGNILVGVSALVAIWGRVRARQRIGTAQTDTEGG